MIRGFRDAGRKLPGVNRVNTLDRGICHGERRPVNLTDSSDARVRQRRVLVEQIVQKRNQLLFR